MREIKFRGRRVDGKGWVYGYLIPKSMLIDPDWLEEIWIATGHENECYPVIPETVGQYTGLKDKNGKEIYEGDIIKDTLTGAILKVCFGYNRNGSYTGWYCEFLNIDRNGNASINADSDSDRNSMIEVIGNIYESPELLTA